jgi:hypothetical protein
MAAMSRAGFAPLPALLRCRKKERVLTYSAFKLSKYFVPRLKLPAAS